MTEIKRAQDEDGNSFAYVVLHNGMDKLLHEIDKFCKGEYGRTCELYKAFIAKKDPSNYPSKVHEFDGVGADMLEKVRNHVKKVRDFVKFEFSANGNDFAIDIVPAVQDEYLVTRMSRDDYEELAETDTVVMVETDGNEPEETLEFLENLR